MKPIVTSFKTLLRTFLTIIFLVLKKCSIFECQMTSFDPIFDLGLPQLIEKNSIQKFLTNERKRGIRVVERAV